MRAGEGSAVIGDGSAVTASVVVVGGTEYEAGEAEYITGGVAATDIEDTEGAAYVTGTAAGIVTLQPFTSCAGATS